MSFGRIKKQLEEFYQETCVYVQENDNEYAHVTQDDAVKFLVKEFCKGDLSAEEMTELARKLVKSCNLSFGDGTRDPVSNEVY